ncbi:MAG: SRPBCC family protein [Ginsengibacter sp.]
MANNISTITINAPMEKVWECLTNPELVKLWQYGSLLVTDWKVGTDIKFIAEWEGKKFEQWGKVLEIKPPEFLKYSLFAPRPGLEDKPSNYFVMNYILTHKDGQTNLEIIQEDNRPGTVQEAPQAAENPVLAELKKLAES